MKMLIVYLLFASVSFGQMLNPEIKKLHDQLDSVDVAKNDLLRRIEALKLIWIQNEMEKIGYPQKAQAEELIKHAALMLSYNEAHEQANWVMHVILTDVTSGNVSRTNDFRIDSLIASGSATEQDYFMKSLKADSTTYRYDGFGYDRGHLAPSADFRWSRTALSESYFYSNMSPQLGDFNRLKWAELENWMRTYVDENKVNLFIVTAPILTDDLPKIPRSVNGLSIPKYYLKVALDMQNQRGIAFVMPNEKITLPIESFSISIDSAEVLLGYDLFSGLADDLETAIEATGDYKFWLPNKEKNDVKEIEPKRLPKGALSTYSIHQFQDDGKKHTVCGKVVSSRKNANGHIFINLDKQFPNQIFSVTIFDGNVINFDYEPEVYLMDQEVCFTGQITDYKGTSSMIIDNGKQVKLLGDY
jgi:endonuclease G